MVVQYSTSRIRPLLRHLLAKNTLPQPQPERERGKTPPPIEVMVVMASMGGESLPDQGEQWPHGKLCSRPVAEGYSGGVDGSPPLKK